MLQEYMREFLNETGTLLCKYFAILRKYFYAINKSTAKYIKTNSKVCNYILLIASIYNWFLNGQNVVYNNTKGDWGGKKCRLKKINKFSYDPIKI